VIFMDCKKVRLLYTDFLEGSIDKQKKREVLEHNKTCDKCRKLYETLNCITSLAGTYERFEPEVGLADKILRRFETIPRGGKFLNPRWVAVCTIMLLFIAGFSIGMFRKIALNKQLIVKKKQEELIRREGKYIIDYGQFEKGQVIYTFPGKGNTVQIVETSY